MLRRASSPRCSVIVAVVAVVGFALLAGRRVTAAREAVSSRDGDGATATARRKLFVLVTGLQGSGTTMMTRVLGHPAHAIAFGGITHPQIPDELSEHRELLLSLGITTDKTWEVADRLDRSPPNATQPSPLATFVKTRGCVG